MLPKLVQRTPSSRAYNDILVNGLKPSRYAVFRLVLCAGIAAAGCRDSGQGSGVIRLQDVFDAAVVEGSVGAAVEIPRTEWRFNDDEAHGWQVGVGVEDLGVTNGRLAGRTTSDFPILHVERLSSVVDDADLLHAVELRVRSSAGNNLQVAFDSGAEPDFRRLLDRAAVIPWRLGTPLLPGEEFHTYTISVLGSSVGGREDLSSGAIRSVLIRPSDAADARFEIESVRLIFREEYLATIPSGVSWQGFRSIFRETLVTRAPETVSYEIVLPSEPWLDLAIATVEEIPLTFRVVAQQGGRETTVLERTLSTSDR